VDARPRLGRTAFAALVENRCVWRRCRSCSSSSSELKTGVEGVAKDAQIETAFDIDAGAAGRTLVAALERQLHRKSSGRVSSSNQDADRRRVRSPLVIR
jgi:hypothetical protein